MTTDKLSRRRLLGGFLAGLAAWLCPRARLATAAPRFSALAAARRPRHHDHTVTYTYDARDRLVRVTDHPLRSAYAGGVAEWRSGGVAEWRSGGVAERRTGGLADWRSGGVTRWPRGGVAE